MKKKVLSVFSLSFLMLFSCMSSPEVKTIYTVGTYSDHRVDFVNVKRKEAVPAVTVDLIIDGIFITTLPQADYDYAIYDSETDFVFLKTAYEKGRTPRTI